MDREDKAMTNHDDDDDDGDDAGDDDGDDVGGLRRDG